MTATDNRSPSRRVAAIQARSEQARMDADAAVARSAQQAQLDLELRREKLKFDQERQAARDAAKKKREQKKAERKAKRQQARAKLLKKTGEALPVIGRRVLIAGPIAAPMAVAWIGQIGFARETLHWPLLGGIVFAAAWEATTAFTGWMYHQARDDGDAGTIFRIATWVFAGSAGLMNYWHALPKGGSLEEPTPKAVSFGAMSLTGIALWELYTLLIHRKKLRADKKLPPARPRFGFARWTQYPRTTWRARSLSIKYGYTTVDQAWAAALAKKAAESGRAPINLTVVRGSATRVATTPLKTWTRPPVIWTVDVRSAVPAAIQTGTGREIQTGTPDRSGQRTETGTQTPGPVRTGDRSETAGADRSDSQTADRSETTPKTGPKKQTRTAKQTGPRKRRKTGPKDRTGSDRDELLDRARDLDSAHLQSHGRHISADNLRAAMRIGKPVALELVKQVRGGHIDVAK